MNKNVSIFGYKQERRKGKTRSSDPKPNWEISCQWGKKQGRKDSMCIHRLRKDETICGGGTELVVNGRASGMGWMDAASKRREGRMEEEKWTSPALCCAAARGGGAGSIRLEMILLVTAGRRKPRRQLALPCNLLAWPLGLGRKEKEPAAEGIPRRA